MWVKHLSGVYQPNQNRSIHILDTSESNLAQLYIHTHTTLKQVIGELVSKQQSAFMKGRMISNATLLAHELVRDFKNLVGSRLCLKVDLQKSFNNINREFVFFIKHCMGFSSRWINWIRA